MFYVDGDWVGLVVPERLASSNHYPALLEHVRAVEAQLENKSAGKYRPYWFGRANRQCLRHFFNRARYVPEAREILQHVLGTACGDHEMYEPQSRNAANMLLSVLTHPSCAHIPVTMYPHLAEKLLPTVRKYEHASDYQQIAIALQLAGELSLTVIDDEAGGAGASARVSANEQDSSGPGVR